MRKLWTRIFLWMVVTLFLFSSCGITQYSEGERTGADIVDIEEPAAQEPASVIVTPSPVPDPTPPPGPTGTTSVRIRAVGDIMMHGPQITAGKQPDGSYDFKHFFEEVKPYLEEADITLGNLETTINTDARGYGGYPLFRSPEALLEALVYAGFNVITTANNHSFDGREFGVVHTLDKLDEYGLRHTGTARSQEERDRILLLEENDIKIAVLAYTYGTNGMEVTISKENLPFMVNYIDFDHIERDITRAREAGAEIIIACMHWGDEYIRLPNSTQRQAVVFLASLGVDIILGSHPHVLQPMERRIAVLDGGGEKEIFVIYSMGNFISNQRDRYKDSGVIVDIEVVKDYDTGTLTLGDIGYVPTWVHRFTRGGRSDYQVLPVLNFMDGVLAGEAGSRLQAVWKETTNHFGEDFEVMEQ